jgi:hypothetical protein
MVNIDIYCHLTTAIKASLRDTKKSVISLIFLKRIPKLKLPRNRFYGIFAALLFSGIILSCDLLSNSMAGYFLDNTEIVEVRGIMGSSITVISGGIVLIPPGPANLRLNLFNPRNFSVKLELLGVPEGKNITAEQIRAAEIAVNITGAAEGDEYPLTLAMYSPDGLRDFPSYPLEIRCVSFETALQNFTVDGVTPPAFDPDQSAFQADVRYSSAEVVLKGTTAHSGAVIELYAGTDASGPVLVKGTHEAETTQNLEVGNNSFYVKIIAPSSSVRGYAVTVNRADVAAKTITGFYFAINGNYYGVGTGVESGSGSISGTNITATVPYGTDLTALAPTISHSGESVAPASGAAQDFTNPVSYTVTAADDSSVSYTVTVNTPQGITISGITVEGLSALMFNDALSAPVAAFTPIAIAISGGTVTAWDIDISGPASSTASGSSPLINFSAPGTAGFYSVNVFATVGGVLYSGSFGMSVK